MPSRIDGSRSVESFDVVELGSAFELNGLGAQEGLAVVDAVDDFAGTPMYLAAAGKVNPAVLSAHNRAAWEIDSRMAAGDVDGVIAYMRYVGATDPMEMQAAVDHFAAKYFKPATLQGRDWRIDPGVAKVIDALAKSDDVVVRASLAAGLAKMVDPEKSAKSYPYAEKLFKVLADPQVLDELHRRTLDDKLVVDLVRGSGHFVHVAPKQVERFLTAAAEYHGRMAGEALKRGDEVQARHHAERLGAIAGAAELAVKDMGDGRESERFLLSVLKGMGASLVGKLPLTGTAAEGPGAIKLLLDGPESVDGGKKTMTIAAFRRASQEIFSQAVWAAIDPRGELHGVNDGGRVVPVTTDPEFGIKNEQVGGLYRRFEERRAFVVEN